jgi:hypothetical protein
MSENLIEDPAGFFMVWTKRGRKPRRPHDDFALAAEEAGRLARLHPGEKFIVLKAVAKFHVSAKTQAGPE